MIDQNNLELQVADIISSLRNLWKSKTANLSEDEIEDQRDIIKSQIHDKMMEVVESKITNLDKLRSYVKDILDTEKLNLERKAEFIAKFKEDYDKASEALTSSINQSLEMYPDLKVDGMSEVDKADTIIKHLDGLLGSETRLDEISGERVWEQSQLEKIIANIAYTKKHALEFCPYCAASTNIEAMDRKRERIDEKISAFYEEEESISNERKGYRESRKELKDSLDEFKARKKSYEQQRDISDGLSEGDG